MIKEISVVHTDGKIMDEFDVDIRIKTYLKKHLKLQWQIDKDCNRYIALTLNGETISKINFETD